MSPLQWMATFIIGLVVTDVYSTNRAKCSGTVESDDEACVERNANREFSEIVDAYNELLKQQRFDEALILGHRAQVLQPQNPVSEVMTLKAKLARQDAFNVVAMWIVFEDSVAARELAEDPDLNEALDDTGQEAGRLVKLSENALDQILFGDGADAESGKKRLSRLLDQEVAAIGQCCRLTDAQNRKIRLAGRGDIQHFSDRVESLRGRFQETHRVGDGIVDEMPSWAVALGAETAKLRRRFEAGLFQADSLFAKSLAKMLTAEQTTAYDAHPLNSKNNDRIHLKGVVRRP